MWWLPRLTRRAAGPTPGAVAALAADGLDPGERLLAGAAGPAGELAAPTHGLWARTPQGWRRTGWEQIDRAAWRDGVLQVTDAGDRPPRRYPLTAPGELPAVVRDRVTASILVNSYHRLGAGGGVRVLAAAGRRTPRCCGQSSSTPA